MYVKYSILFLFFSLVCWVMRIQQYTFTIFQVVANAYLQYLLIDGLACKGGLQGGGSSREALCSLLYLVHISCWCSRSRERLPDTQKA